MLFASSIPSVGLARESPFALYQIVEVRMYNPWSSDRPAPGADLSPERIITGAEAVGNRLKRTLPHEDALLEIATAVVQTARIAQIRVRNLASPIGFPRIRLYVVVLFVAILGWWIYTNYFATRIVRVAVTGGESTVLEAILEKNGARDVDTREGEGSPHNLAMVQNGDADMAVVQAGIPIPEGLTVLGTVARKEHVLYFRRGDSQMREGPQRVITFRRGQGSEILGDRFFELWGYGPIEWAYVWEGIADGSYFITDADSTIFVVVDPADSYMQVAIARVAEAGFVLQDPNIGVHATSLPYLEPIEIEVGYYLSRRRPVPRTTTSTFAVDAYLVAGSGLTERQRNAALVAFGLQAQGGAISAGDLLHSSGSSVMEDLATALAALMNLVVLLAALFGLEILFHRRYLHELNNMISRISLLQAEHDLLGLADRKEVENDIAYLDGCADLLGIISTITGYYGQQNAALVFSGLTGQLHARANDLKINIRLKLLHAEWRTPTDSGTSPPLS